MKVDGRRERAITTSSPAAEKKTTTPKQPRLATPSTFTAARAPKPPWKHPGLAEYPPEQQRFMTTLHAGTTATAVRFRAALERPDVVAMPPKDQLLAALNVAVPWTIEPERRTTVKTPPAHTLSAATVDPAYAFHGVVAPAEVFVLTVGDQKIPIARPADAHYEGGVAHPVDAVVQTLLELPATSRAQITSVSINPMSSPDDAYWDQVYGTTGTKSYMTCGAAGQVTIYPMETAMTPEVMRSSMTHETGHAWSLKRWGSEGTGPQWDAWAAAGVSDGMAVSSYGNSNLLEDLAEANTLYLESKGQPAFAEYRALYPARFAILDRELGGAS